MSGRTCDELGVCNVGTPQCAGCTTPVTSPLTAGMQRAGYVTTAPACGDCSRSQPEPQGTFCRRHMVLVHEDARCLHWQPAAHWLRANPTVAPLYCGLSPDEFALLPGAVATERPQPW